MQEVAGMDHTALWDVADMFIRVFTPYLAYTSTKCAKSSRILDSLPHVCEGSTEASALAQKGRQHGQHNNKDQEQRHHSPMMVTLMMPVYASSTTAPKMMLHDASAMPVTTCMQPNKRKRVQGQVYTTHTCEARTCSCMC